MAKQEAKPDLFGIKDPEDGADEGADYVILQAIAADGWRAVFNDPTGGPPRVLGLASYALVEILQEDPQQPPMRAVRPMVVNEFGQVDDVEFFDDFICLVPPGADVQQTLEYAIRLRAQVEQAAQK